MLKVWNRLARGTKGMEAVQAVILVAVALLIGYGVYAIWNDKGGVKEKITNNFYALIQGNALNQAP